MPDGAGNAMEGMPGATSSEVCASKVQPGSGISSWEERNTGATQSTGSGKFKKGKMGRAEDAKMDPGQRAMGEGGA